MKTIKTAFVAVIMILIATTVNAQTAKPTEVKIKTSAVCGMCKKTIEKALSKEAGIQKSTLDVTTKVVTVVYDPKVTSPEKIRTAISKAGYDADAIKADPKAYKNLDECCKKEDAKG
ncbi:MAG: MerP [Bacteroidetes bacterium]|nr:MerP [Bacteroidota bacterium]